MGLIGVLLKAVGFIPTAVGIAILTAYVSPDFKFDKVGVAMYYINRGLLLLAAGYVLQWYGKKARMKVQDKIDALRQKISALEAERE